MGKFRYAALCGAWLACHVAFAAAPATSATGAGHRGTEAVLPLDTQVEGEGYPELTARWWQWAMAGPIEPYLDPDGRLCAMNQYGPVWFLAGTSGGAPVHRTCVVPSGKYLLLPVINMMYAQTTPRSKDEQRMPCDELRSHAAVNNDKLVSAVVLIDGKQVADIPHYRVRSHGCFPVAVDADGKAGPDVPRASSDGYWLLLAPLSAGRHTIVVGANYGADGDVFGRMVQNFEYVLDVGGKTPLVRADGDEVDELVNKIDLGCSLARGNVRQIQNIAHWQKSRDAVPEG